MTIIELADRARRKRHSQARPLARRLRARRDRRRIVERLARDERCGSSSASIPTVRTCTSAIRSYCTRCSSSSRPATRHPAHRRLHRAHRRPERPQRTASARSRDEAIDANMRSYREQAGKVLDLERVEVTLQLGVARHADPRRPRSSCCRRRPSPRCSTARTFANRYAGGHADRAPRVSLSGRAGVRLASRSRPTSNSAAPTSSSTCCSAVTISSTPARKRRSA